MELLSNSEIVIGDGELVKKIEDGRKLKIKFGVDPTRPDLTFGHLVVFKKLRQFQDAGHETILLIGDYTARIGDPSGRSALRPELTEEEVGANAQTYLDQAFRVLDKTKTIVRRNSEWFSKMSFADSLSLTRKMTVARMLERDDFSNRYKENKPISMVEFMYPLVQGYDSVVLESDVEIGGSDQLFNMLVGRSLQKDLGFEPQAVMTMPLLVGLDGVRKMSKSYDNYIAFNDTSRDIFGKIMSIPDNVMDDYYRLLLNYDEPMLDGLKSRHPMEIKKQLAVELTASFFGRTIAEKELSEFANVFSKGQLPEEIPSFSIASFGLEDITLLNLIFKTGVFESKGQIRRLFKQGAIKLNGNGVKDPEMNVKMPTDQDHIVVKVGKKVYLKFEK